MFKKSKFTVTRHLYNCMSNEIIRTYLKVCSAIMIFLEKTIHIKKISSSQAIKSFITVPGNFKLSIRSETFGYAR